MMSLDELLDDRINLNGHQSEGFIDPMSMKIPHSTRDITEDWDLPDISDIEEVPPPKKDQK